LSEKYEATSNEFLLQSLLAVQTAAQLQGMVNKLEPEHKEYLALKQAYLYQLGKRSSDSASRLLHSLDIYRWIHHFHFDQFVVVNLPAARLQYFENDIVILDMKTVVGKPATTTPRFATICDQAILYPYWYVPRSITFNESLPKIKANPGWIDANNMQVIDGNGKVMDPYKLNWSSFHSGYFPYTLRQSTGCDNALGVIKFNIITPYGVYLHDTNNKTAFLAGARFFSHGCIRLEDPIGLGNRLLKEKLDTNFLKACFKEQKPIPVQLKKPLPVFVVYMTVAANANGKLNYYKDVYKLLR
jgi:L,D-transpeptidase YcbB